MLIAEKIIDSLHGVEGAKGYFDEDRAPIAHGTIPKAGQLKGTKLAAVLRLVGDEARVRVDVVGKVKGLAHEVPAATH